MTPKEKAIDLVDRFIKYTPVEFEHEYSKHCALICVDEMIRELNPENFQTAISSSINYWHQVEQEIEKL